MRTCIRSIDDLFQITSVGRIAISKGADAKEIVRIQFFHSTYCFIYMALNCSWTIVIDIIPIAADVTRRFSVSEEDNTVFRIRRLVCTVQIGDCFGNSSFPVCTCRPRNANIIDRSDCILCSAIFPTQFSFCIIAACIVKRYNIICNRSDISIIF